MNASADLRRAAARIAPRIALLLSSAVAFAAPPDPFAESRRLMVRDQIERRGISTPGVLRAMAEVPRHLFVPEDYRGEAYADSPQPIGNGQTISQPYIVALMTSLLELDDDDTVLEIGTGSGYQAAVLAQLAREVYTIEILEPLARQAERVFADLKLRNVHTRVGDGYQGWPEAAPFDAVIVTAAPRRIPEPLIEQLKIGGRMVIPVGDYFQDLMVVTKTADGVVKKNVLPVRFVPMTGEVEKKPPD
jgi:protein-L-isoaspartate(D-aspartate) O-methyltransferase